MENSKRELVTLTQLSKEMNTTKVTISRWIKEKKFPAYNVVINNRVKYWTREVLNQFFDRGMENSK